MTTIIGVQHDDGCTLLADSRTTDGSGRIYSHSSVKKLSECGPAIVGGSGEVMPCDITQHIWIAPPLTVKDKKDPFHYMITKAMPSLRKCLTQHGYNFDDPSPGETRFQFLWTMQKLLIYTNAAKLMLHSNLKVWACKNIYVI